MKAALLAILGAATLSGCALLEKSAPVVPRYFTPEYDAGPAAAPAGLQLRLGRVVGWFHLRERMVSRNAAGEVAYAEGRRWTERPEVYLRRALARTLFEERGMVEVVSGRAVTLDVELIAFEELGEPHRVRLQAGLVLRDDRASLLQETITVEQPVASIPGADQAPAVVDAYAQALRAGVSRIADRVVAKLAK
jgi:cholesterol transport system auxiliary component